MGFMHEVRREFIAVPDVNRGQMVFKWPDEDIRKFARAIVEPDELAVFMTQGQVMGVLPPGQHTLDSRELPFLGSFLDWASQGDLFHSELYYVETKEFPGIRFGGRLDDVQDPQTGLVVTMRAFGEFALKVVDPTKLLLNLVGTVNVTSNEAITDWVGQQLLKVTRTAVTTQLVQGNWPILGLSAYLPQIEQMALTDVVGQLANYGVSITRLGNLDINLADEDAERLKKLAGDTAYSRLAGGFLQAAQAEALQGAGEGMSQGGGAVSPMFLGAGLGMAGSMMQAPGQQPGIVPPPAPGFSGGGAGYTPPPAPAPGPASAIAAPIAAVASEVGSPAGSTTAVQATCPNCHAELRPGAKFCDSCGTAVQATCSNCHAELRPGAKFCDSCGTAVASVQAASVAPAGSVPLSAPASGSGAEPESDGAPGSISGSPTSPQG